MFSDQEFITFYEDVFKLIFEALQQEQYCQMMMGEGEIHAL